MAIRNAIINVMAKTCYKASKSLLRDFGEVEQLQASRKGPEDFVFTANSASQKKIVEELTYARPDYGFLIKGTKLIESKDPKNRRWIIDPLNGSTNFLHGIPHWAISIGLEEEGDLVAGAIYDATRDELFWAEKGLGAYLNDSRIRISERRDLSECLIAIGSQPEEGDITKFNSYLEGITKSSSTTRNLGSGSLNLAYLAAGRFDGFWQLQIPAPEIAAGIIIVREAGGYITDLGGGIQMLSKKEILAANARTHHRLLRLIKTIKEEEN
jgi:myo-inositol-1(or 4)-monophosphatase